MKRIAAWIALICLWIGCAESAFAKPILPSQQDDMQDDAQQEPKTVRIPDTAAEIFYEYVGERSVSAFEVSPDHPTLTSVDGVLFSKDRTRLLLFPAGRTGELYSVPEGTKVIGKRAFERCSMDAVELPASVEELGYDTFEFCEAEIRVSPDNPIFAVEDGALLDWSQKLLVHYDFSGLFWKDEALMSMGMEDGAKPELEEKTCRVPDGIEVIGNSAFSLNYLLTEVQLPESLERIGESAFAYCLGLRKVDIPDNVKVIGRRAFQGSGLSEIHFGKGVERIEDWAFAECMLSEIEIPDSAAEVSCLAFESNELERFIVSPDHPTLSEQDGVLFSKDGTELISYPRNRGGMQDGEVYRIPDGTKRIAESAFYHCRWELTVVVPDSVEEIHPLAFWGGDVTLRVGEGSYAQRFAEEENYDYVIGE